MSLPKLLKTVRNRYNLRKTTEFSFFLLLKSPINHFSCASVPQRGYLQTTYTSEGEGADEMTTLLFNYYFVKLSTKGEGFSEIANPNILFSISKNFLQNAQLLSSALVDPMEATLSTAL